MSGLVLYADYGCPFAHRVLALLTLLDVDYQQELVPLGRPPSLSHLGASLSRIPMLKADDLFLTESRVINEYLVERFGYEAAFPSDLRGRAVHRHALALVDEHFARGYFAPLSPRRRGYLEASLDVFESAMSRGASPSLFAIHFATAWRFVSQSGSGLTNTASIIASRPALVDWAEELISLHCIASTSPDEARLGAEFARARESGAIAV